VVCPSCQANLDPAVGVCPRCGSKIERAASGDEPPWRQQIRETVQRRKEKRKRQLEKRDEDGRQLSIFPESADSVSAKTEDPARERRAEIKARVEEKLAKTRRTTGVVRNSEPSGVADVGDVAIPLGAASMAATAPELDAPLSEFDTEEPEIELSDDPAELVEPARDEAPTLEPASPGERILAGLIDLGILAFMMLALAYLTTRVGGYPLRLLPTPALAALGVVGFFMVAGYYLFFWSLSGQTMGKLLTGLRVVKVEGGALGFKRALGRGLGILLSILPLGAGFLGLWSDPDRRGWHDRVASTKVIRA
jgi:uncharacterized RDD family membrane protein YckC